MYFRLQHLPHVVGQWRQLNTGEHLVFNLGGFVSALGGHSHCVTDLGFLSQLLVVPINIVSILPLQAMSGV